MLHSPKAEEGRKLYRFERGVEDPVILLLKGVEGKLEDFCVIKATSLYTSFPAYTHPMGIGQEKAKTRGDLEECHRVEEAAGFEIKFAKEGRLLLAGTDRFYEYEEGKEITSFAIDHYRSFYHGELHLSECGYILTSDVIEGENGMETTLPEEEQ